MGREPSMSIGIGVMVGCAARRSSALLAGAVVGNDSVVGNPDQLVDDRRRLLAALQMLAHGADRQFRQQELGAANFVAAGATKYQLSEAREAGFHMPGLRCDAVVQSLGPAALQEIIAVIEQQEARFVE